jgi:hypothetical protein
MWTNYRHQFALTLFIKVVILKLLINRIRRKNQQYALIVPLLYFYVFVPTCFGSSLPSSGSLLDPPELLENTNGGGGISYNVWLRGLQCKTLASPGVHMQEWVYYLVILIQHARALTVHGVHYGDHKIFSFDFFVTI